MGQLLSIVALTFAVRWEPFKAHGAGLHPFGFWQHAPDRPEALCIDPVAIEARATVGHSRLTSCEQTELGGENSKRANARALSIVLTSFREK
ncbi:hypothetical protein CBOM_00677 [Ceraceosorus bombacis]|uniref:Uncharacterized protein n=1 Tax=Ceraceosorus bombacis TaxID=401625 RepID=A0A0P1BB65_9BASI|nr:hypothetical protein CBOM_00677 [Ceraceosorus bombacis]